MPWWRRARRGREVEVLTRAGCHLCQEMVATVRAETRRGRHTVQIRDIDDEVAQGRITPPEHARWTTEIPVLLVDGRAVARWRVSVEELRATLRSGAGHPQG